MAIECAVLEGGTRVISERAFARGLGLKRGGSHWQRRRRHEEYLPLYLSAHNLRDYIGEDLASALSKPIIYEPKHGGSTAFGLRADLLPEVCNVWLKARDENALHSSQQRVARAADILIRGLATVGIVALVDAATGYEQVRARNALEKILERFIAKELVKWAKVFPDEFYEQIFRLRGWEYRRIADCPPKRPGIVAHYTTDIVYSRLAPGVLEELKRVTPRDGKGRLKHKLFQRLTEDVGHPKLREHLVAVTALMRASPNWSMFYRLLQRAYPKYMEQQEMFELEATADEPDDRD
jgi:hypothetical protein